MNLLPLRELCALKHGGTPSKASPEYWRGEIPWVSPKDMKQSVVIDATDHISSAAIQNSATSIVPQGSTLVVVRSGILAHSLPVAWVGKPVAFNQDIKAVLPTSPEVDAEFLYWFIRSQASHVVARGVKKGATVHSVQSGFIENLMVPMLPRAEQRRVVDLLTRAEGIVRLRREAQHKAAELIPAIFIDMFGEPTANPPRLPTHRVSDIVARFEGGKNLQAGDAADSALRILKVSAVTSGTYRESECKPTPNGYVPPANHFVRAGDLLFSRANTAELVGATAVVETTGGNTLLPDKLWRIVWRRDIDVGYMHALFQTPAIRRELSKLASGTSDSMRNISQAKLFDLRLPIAGVAQQRRFGELSRTARSVIAQQAHAVRKAQATFDALLARAFA